MLADRSCSFSDRPAQTVHLTSKPRGVQGLSEYLGICANDRIKKIKKITGENKFCFSFIRARKNVFKRGEKCSILNEIDTFQFLVLIQLCVI